MYHIRRGGAIASQHEKLQNSHAEAVSAASQDVDHCACIGNELGLRGGHRTSCSTAVENICMRYQCHNRGAPWYISAIARRICNFSWVGACLDLPKLQVALCRADTWELETAHGSLEAPAAQVGDCQNSQQLENMFENDWPLLCTTSLHLAARTVSPRII